MATKKQPAQLVAMLVMHQHRLGALSDNDIQLAIKEPYRFLNIAIHAWIERNRREGELVRAIASFDFDEIKHFDANTIFSGPPEKQPRCDQAFNDTYAHMHETNIQPCRLRSYDKLHDKLKIKDARQFVRRTTLAHLHMLMALPWDEDWGGMLVHNGYPNVFLIPNRKGVDGIVRVSGSKDHWYLQAGPIMDERLALGRIISS